MKKYIGTKQVWAEPMQLCVFINKYQRDPYAGCIEKHDPSQEGYVVTYKDGYVAWSPKEVFEEAYKCAETFLDRLKIEFIELQNRTSKCAEFTNSDKFREVVKGEYPAFLLMLQKELMLRYLQVLGCRICLAEPNTWGDVVQNMSFGIAIEALKFGLSIRREGWNGKGLFVCKQVPAHIEGTAIPGMQSLPQSAKNIIMDTTGCIDYTSQCLIYNTNTGRADSWVPSVSDMFAEDWEIVMPDSL